MRRIIFLFCVGILVIPISSFSQTYKKEEDALYDVLLRIDASIEIGVNYIDFSKLLVDAQFLADKLSASKSSKNGTQLLHLFEEYKLSFRLWRYFIDANGAVSKYYIDTTKPTELMMFEEKYPGFLADTNFYRGYLFKETALNYVWGKIRSNLEIIRKDINKETIPLESDPSKTKKMLIK